MKRSLSSLVIVALLVILAASVALAQEPAGERDEIFLPLVSSDHSSSLLPEEPVSAAALSGPIQLDVNSGSNRTESGFTPLLGNPGQFVTEQGIDFTLFGFQSGHNRDRNHSSDLLTDFAFQAGDNGAVGLRIANLPAGSYNVESWHYEPLSLPGTIQIEYRKQGGNSTVLIDQFDITTGDAASYVIHSDGTSTYELVFRQDDANKRTRFNGIHLSRVTTSNPTKYFQVDAVDGGGNVNSLNCTETQPADFIIYPGADTTTRWSGSNWLDVSNLRSAETAYALKYVRESYARNEPAAGGGTTLVRGVAYGGRCESQLNSTLSGNGELSVRMFIHSNMLNPTGNGTSSSGVFTVGLFADAGDTGVYDPDYEFDLVTVNLVQSSSTPLLKWGWANHGTYGIDVDRVDHQWITVTATIEDDPTSNIPSRKRCTVVIERESSGTRVFKDDGSGNPDWVPCNIPSPGATATKGRIVVNSRARSPEPIDARFPNPEDDNSMITIDYIKWIQQP